MNVNAKYSVAELLDGSVAIDSSVIVAGWVLSRRDSKAGISFITLSDGSIYGAIQIIASHTLENYTTAVLNLSKDCAIIVHGKLVKSPGHKQAIEIVANNIIVTGFIANPDTYHMSAKAHTPEFLREHLHTRIRTQLIANVMRIRNTVSYSIHEFLQQHGFYWVHTPIITALDCEGAGELFKVSHLDLTNLPYNTAGDIDYKQDFFGTQTHLTVSGQLNVEAYCLALSRVYTFGPTFRAEKSNTTRHLAEFWMIEPEIAFADLRDDINLAQQLLQHICKTVLNKHTTELEFLTKNNPDNIITRVANIVNADFEIMSYTTAIKLLQQATQTFEHEVYWGVDFAAEHERYLCKLTAKPAVIIDFPKEIKAFYMRQNDDDKTVAAMDILVPGVGEIIGGSQREERYELLVQRMEQLGIDKQPLDWYIDLRRYGSAPHAGFGLGLERVLSYITGIANVRDLIPFPRSPQHAPC